MQAVQTLTRLNRTQPLDEGKPNNQVVHVGSGVGYLRHCNPRGAGYRRQPVRTLAEINRVTRDQYLYPRRRTNHSEGARRAAGGKLRCPLWWHG